MTFAPPRWWAVLRLLFGGVCALGFSMRATPTPGLYPGFLGMLGVDGLFLLLGLWGLWDWVRPLRLVVGSEGLRMGRGATLVSRAFGELGVALHYTDAGEAGAGRFRSLEISTEERRWRWSARTLAQRSEATSALLEHRTVFKGWRESLRLPLPPSPELAGSSPDPVGPPGSSESDS